MAPEVYGRIEAPASKSFAAEANEKSAPEINGRHPLTWLNLVCLDAPLVALGWQYLFARSFGLSIAPGGTWALFLTAWLIYLTDRFADSLLVHPTAATSLRQRFCRQHRRAWLKAVPVIALADLIIIVTQLQPRQFLSGAFVGFAACFYLAVNQSRPSLWRVVPLKEVSIGFLFAAGVMVALDRGLTSATTQPAWWLFAVLCSLNCICIACWERELDAAQQRVSIATAFPQAERAVWPVLGLLVIASVAFAPPRPGFCLATGAGLLATVHLWRHRINPDVRTVLADLVLLTPWLALAFM